MEFQTTNWFNQIIKRRLIDIGVLHIDKLLTVLVKEQAVIAGSFPLQCILGETYEGSDIDIFYQLDPLKMRDHLYHPALEQHIYDVYKLNSFPEEYLLNGIVRTRKFKISDRLHFNLIAVNVPPKTFVKDAFDFSFCQTYFDGTKTTFRPVTLSKVGTIANYPKIKDKQSYHVNAKKEATVAKMGFPEKFVVNVYPPNIKELIADNLEQRREKYKQRGFIIMEHLDFMLLKETIKNEHD